MKQDPLSGAVFLFCNKRKNILKAIWWDKTGFWVAQKKLERHKWPWPSKKEEVNEITAKQFAMLLTGIDFTQMHDELQKDLDSNVSLANDYEEYSKYFDISNTHEYIFWDAVLSFKGKNIKDFSCSTVNELNKSVMAYLDIPIECPNLYSLNKDEHIELLRQIHNKTSIDITSLLKKVGKDIESYNTSKIENQVKLFEKQFLYKLWCKLVKNKTLRPEFVNYRNYYLNALFKDKIREELKYSLDFNAEKELCNVIFNDPNFGFMLDSGIDNDTIPVIKIRHFYKQYEEYVNQPKNDYRFYFMGYKNDFENLKNKENENNGQNTNDEELDFEEEWGTASEKVIPESKNKKPGHGGSHSKRTEKEKLKKGTKAEEWMYRRM